MTIPQKENELLVTAGDPLVIGMQPTLYTGQPPRDRAPRAIVVPRGGWGRIILNGRHTSYSGQHYRQATYNVGFVDVPSATLFSGEPKYRVSFEADLF